ncbi:MAG: hypothetical protein EWM73_00117 [Nitrospira sp.]|nr:MAG: hypothetical protein EWM73_00117 [Nitrospira sp.]
MPVTLRPFRRFPVPCALTYHASLFRGYGTGWNLSWTGGRLSGDQPMRPGEPLSLTVTLPNEQRIEMPEAGVVSQEFGSETVQTLKQTQARLIHHVQRVVNNSLKVLHG